MTKNTVLLAVAFGIAGMVSVSCGGDSGSDTSGNAGTTSTTAGQTTGGSPATGGTTATAGTTNTSGTTNTGGTTSTAGNTTGGNTTGGRVNTGGFTNQGGAAPMLMDCPAGTMDGGMCTLAMNGASNTCQLDADTFCTCRSRQGGMPTYRCRTIILPGTGGQNAGGQPGFGDAMCGDAPMNGAECTGFGPCANSNTCACFNEMVFCQ
jgi:hypothetical protein